jgi:outer membrane biosynthesis protein TonB
MKRAITTLGVLGLAAIAVAAPAVADRGGDEDDKIIICHAGSGSNSGHFTANSVAVPSLNGHDEHSKDIIPPNDGMEDGQNWDAVGQAIHANGCVVLPPVVVQPIDVPPVVIPPVDVPPVEVPPVDVTPVIPPADVPPAATPVVVPEQSVVVPEQPVVVPEQPAAVLPQAEVPQAEVPQAAAAAPAAGATASTIQGTNQGYNAQTAVGGSDSAPSWLAGLGALLTAGAAVAFRRKSRAMPLAD